MKKVSRSIIYNEKESIGFFLGEGDTLERCFINNLWKRPFMQELDDASVNILRLFNNACYICTLAYEGDYPLLDLKEFENIAIDGHDDPIWTNHIFPATMALVVIWLNSDESQQLYKNNSQKKNIEELYKGICVNVEESNTLPDEGKEEFHALISYEHRLPSGFINEMCFQRRPFTEVLVDPIGKYEVFDNTEYLFDMIKNNTNELTTALESDSVKKMISKQTYNENEIISGLTEWFNKKLKDDNEQSPRGSGFTSRQTAIIAYALCKKGNVIPKNKKSIASLFNKLTGRSVNVLEQNLCSTYSDEEIEKIAATIENDMPEFAKYIREKTFYLPEMKK